MSTTNLYDVSPVALETVLGEFASPPFRARQIAGWLYHKQVSSFEEMTNLSREVREALASRFSLERPRIEEVTEPTEDGSRKFLFRLADGSRIESVAMPMRDRTTLCVSSQAGCAVGCTFCVTGFFGSGRNLSPAEILGQIHVIQREQAIPPEKLNVVFMGMGEPLLNLDHLETTLDILSRSISLRRVTISTSGIVPGIDALARREHRPNLALSLNAPDPDRREAIMPITRKYPLVALMSSLRRYPLERGRVLTIEYVLLAGWNDAPKDAALLAELIDGLRTKVNLIPFNPDPALPGWMKRPTDQAIDRFAAALVREDVDVTVRRSKGLEIAAACGQLRGTKEARA